MIRPHYALCAAARGLRATVAATTARLRSSARLRPAVFRPVVQFAVLKVVFVRAKESGGVSLYGLLLWHLLMECCLLGPTLVQQA